LLAGTVCPTASFLHIDMAVFSKPSVDIKVKLEQMQDLIRMAQDKAASIAAEAAGVPGLVMSGALHQTHEPCLPDYIKQQHKLGGGSFGDVYELDWNITLECLKGKCGVVKVCMYLTQVPKFTPPVALTTGLASPPPLSSHPCRPPVTSCQHCDILQLLLFMLSNCVPVRAVAAPGAGGEDACQGPGQLQHALLHLRALHDSPQAQEFL
jgi:hypothetical protein